MKDRSIFVKDTHMPRKKAHLPITEHSFMPSRGKLNMLFHLVCIKSFPRWTTPLELNCINHNHIQYSFSVSKCLRFPLLSSLPTLSIQMLTGQQPLLSVSIGASTKTRRFNLCVSCSRSQTCKRIRNCDTNYMNRTGEFESWRATFRSCYRFREEKKLAQSHTASE